MLSFNEYLNRENYNYDSYCSDVDLVAEAVFAPSSSTITEELIISESFNSIRKEILELFKLIRDHFYKSGINLKISASEISRAFRSKSIYESLKYFGFSIRSLFAAIQDITAIPSNALVKAFEDLRSLTFIQSLDQRAEEFDRILENNPVIKLMTGPLVAALLVLIWLNMTFTGNIKHDMDISKWFKAITGDFYLKELFTSAEGMSMITFLFTGLITGGALSFVWLGSSILNLIMAFGYITLKIAGTSPAQLHKIKEYLTSKMRLG